MTETLRLAHRGDWRNAPENSLAAMQAAVAIHACDGLELDVRGTADGVPILLHDASLRRVQGVDAMASALTAAECAGHGIPALGDVLRAIGCDPFLDVELKEWVPAAIDLLELERGRVDDDDRPTLRNTAISSFDAGVLASLAEARPTWPRWLNAISLTPSAIELAVDLGCAAVSVGWTAIDEPGLRRAADAGLAVAAWTVRELADYRRLSALGVVAICAEGAALDG